MMTSVDKRVPNRKRFMKSVDRLMKVIVMMMIRPIVLEVGVVRILIDSGAILKRPYSRISHTGAMK